MYRRTYVYEPKFKLPKYTWDKDRKLCERCKHYEPVQTGSGSGRINISMTCLIGKNKHAFGPSTCIEERTSGNCGPKGKLFSPQEPNKPR